jgi:hypothetical protein
VQKATLQACCIWVASLQGRLCCSRKVTCKPAHNPTHTHELARLMCKSPPCLGSAGCGGAPGNQVRLDTPDLPWLPEAHHAIKGPRQQVLVTLGCHGRREAGHAVAVALRGEGCVGAGVDVPQQHLAVVMTCGASRTAV